METLPNVLLEHIFSFLNFRQIALAAKVCRTWNKMTSEAEIWESLFVRRWGKDEATALVNLSPVSSWKSAYEVHDRRERVGKEWSIIREGDWVYTAKNGVLLRCLVCPRANTNIETSASSWSDPYALVQAKRKRSVEDCGGISTTQMEGRTYNSGLLDKMIYFAADLHSQKHPGEKHMRIRK